MKLFHWQRANCNKVYSHGDIIVMANNLDEARKIAMEFARKHVKYLGYTDMDWLRTSEDPDDVEDFRRRMEEVERDLREPPVIFDRPSAIFINGGE